MKRYVTVLLALLLLPLPLPAADPDVRPATKDTALGRVFMTSAERKLLDQLRKLSPQTDAATDSTITGNAAQSGQKEKPDPSGYIIPAEGSAYKWIGGSFRKITRNEINPGQLPGSVRIIRHRRPAADGGSADSTVETGGVGPAEERAADAETGNENQK